MNKTLALVSGMVTLALGAGTALAGGSSGSIGVGAEYQLGRAPIMGGSIGLGGVSANYDAGKFHVGGFLGFSDGGGTDDTDVVVGARFFYHIHSTAMSDFGLGASMGLGFIGDRTPNVNNNDTDLFIEPGFQVRAFVASNVALSFFGGISLGLVDANGASLSGQPTAAAGVHYYFF